MKKKLSNKEFILIINKIETDFPVEDLKYKNVKLWPFLRLTLMELLIGENVRKHISNSEKSSLFSLIKVHFKKRIQCFNTKDTFDGTIYPKTDILYFAKPDERKHKINNKYFNQFGNSLEYFCLKSKLNLSFNMLEIESNKFKEQEKFGNSIYFKRNHTETALEESRISLYNKIYFAKSNRIKMWESFISYLELLSIDYNYSEMGIVERFEKILSIKKNLIKILENYKPKLIFYCWFAHDYGFALSLAGRELGIKTVELQHGQQGPFNGMYSNWYNYPFSGYDLIPNIFWMWSQSNVKRIENWSKNSEVHEVIVGGNTWLSYNLLNKIEIPKKLNAIKHSHNKKVVLLSLQNVNIPKFLYETMSANKEIYWLIRFHPRLLDLKNQILEDLKKLSIENYNISDSNNLPLISLFKVVDVQVTFWSSVAYEALIFDVPTILIHENGKDEMKEYIDEQIFYFCKDSTRLQELIINQEKYFQKEKRKYIEVDGKIIINSINKLVQNK